MSNDDLKFSLKINVAELKNLISQGDLKGLKGNKIISEVLFNLDELKNGPDNEYFVIDVQKLFKLSDDEMSDLFKSNLTLPMQYGTQLFDDVSGHFMANASGAVKFDKKIIDLFDPDHISEDISEDITGD